MSAGLRSKGVLRIAGLAATFALAVSSFAIAPAALAQGLSDGSAVAPGAGAGPPLNLSAREVVFDHDTDTITVSGNVRISYGGIRMAARRLEYDRRRGRLRAFGDIEIVEPDGDRIFAEELDVTDDFADGFVRALRNERPDDTRFTADSAERIGGRRVIFDNGAYTACKVCEDNPGKPPLWQITARRVIQDGETRTIRLESPRFQIFGTTVAALPSLTFADHTVERQTGFLPPTFGFSRPLGFQVGVPYHVAIAPDRDLTVTVSGLSRQGVLTEGEFRQRFARGRHTFNLAGIVQASPGSFGSGTIDRAKRARGLVASRAEFEINPRWTLGWDAMIQSDRNFAKTYRLNGFRRLTQESKIYLTGRSDRNYFDLRAQYFDIQSADPESAAEGRQPILHPSFDYARTFDNPVAGGELTLNVNARSLTRREAETVEETGRDSGIRGTSTRLTSELAWERTHITRNGLLLTPLLAARADVTVFDVDAPTGFPGPFTSGGGAVRGLFTAGLEARYPFVIRTARATHIAEPIGQIFARNDERLAGRLPNEDAHSFVFDASTLFERDKFSGFDRVEGGIRANIGVRAQTTFHSGVSVRGIFGQSFHLAGLNSFAVRDHADAGIQSGLETRRSDYVGSLGIDSPSGFSFTADGRFDERTFALQSSNIGVDFSGDRFRVSASYATARATSDSDASASRQELKGAARLRLAEHWHTFGSLSYDIDRDFIATGSAGLAYEDECFGFSLVYSRSESAYESADWSILARISLRTLGDFGVGTSDLDRLFR